MYLRKRILLVACALSWLIPGVAFGYEQPVDTPNCDEADGEVRIIDEAADFEDVNSDQYRIFCVRPGDYSSVSITLTASGTESEPRYLIYDAPDGADVEQTHPVQLSSDQRAQIQELILDDADRWIVQGLFIDGGDRIDPTGQGVEFLNGSSHNVVDRIVVQHSRGTMVQIEHGSSENTVQNSVIRETQADPDNPSKDYHCVHIKGDHPGTLRNRIVRNEIYDCAGDSIHLSGCPYWRFDAAEIDYDCDWEGNVDQRFAGDARGTIIYDNDLYFTSEFTDVCNGTCGCFENAIDVKSAMGSVDRSTITEDDWVRIEQNRIWNDCGPKGSATIFHYANSDYVLFRHNVVFNNWGRGYRPTVKDDPFVDHHSVIGNVFADLGGMVTVSRIAADLEFYNNTAVRIDDGGDNLAGYGDSHHFDMQCNAFVDGGGWSFFESEVNVDYNTYYDTPIFGSGPNDQSFSSVDDAEMEDLCFERRIWSAPEEHCIPDALSTENSPHIDHCTDDLGAYDDVGVHDGVDPDFFTWYHEAEEPGAGLSATVDAEPSDGPAPLEVAFAAQVDGGESPLQVEWTFGDGTTATGEDELVTAHTYAEPGLYTASAQLTDADGNSTEATTEIDVVDPDELVFSPIPYFGNAANYQPRNSNRWDVAEQSGDRRLFLNTSDYVGSDEIPGEFTLIRDRSYDDFEFVWEAKTNENLGDNEFADFVVVFNYKSEHNYDFILAHHQAEYAQIFSLREGQRELVEDLDASLLPDEDWHEYSLVQRDERLELTMDGTTVVDIAYSPPQSGRLGVGSFDESVYFDNIDVPGDTTDGDDAGGTGPDAGATGTSKGDPEGCACSSTGDTPLPAVVVVSLGGLVLLRRRNRSSAIAA